VFFLWKNLENTEFAITRAILDGRENWSAHLIAPSTLFCLMTMIDSKSTNQNLQLTGDGFWVGSFFSPPTCFVTHPRPIFARIQDGTGELCGFGGFSAIKTPSNCRQAG